MGTITYCKGLPTPTEEMNALGQTKFEMFLNAYAPIFRRAVCETVNHLLQTNKFDKSTWNTHLQCTYNINKRHANGIIACGKGAVDSGKECRKKHIKILDNKLKSAKSWLTKSVKKLKASQKFYRKRNWYNSKTGVKYPVSCLLKNRLNTWQCLKFQIHNKKRYIYKLEQQIKHLKEKSTYIKVPHEQCFIVGSKDESFGNQTCQWDGQIIRFRVPYCLQSKFGKYVETNLGNFKRNINRLPNGGAKTWHFYRKQGKWIAAVQFTPTPVKRVSQLFAYGSIGIDMNPGSIGWAYVDFNGNLKAHGQISLQMGLPRGKQDAQIVDACLQLATLANTYSCPIICEELDFTKKKETLREAGKKYARMLSSWAYSRFYELLDSICSNRGIYVIKVNPVYTSLIGLVKYARQYGIGSDVAAALSIARRGMRLTEKLPRSITAYLSVKDRKHVWSLWNQVNKKIKSCTVIQSNRHCYYSISNWEPVVKEPTPPGKGTKHKRASG